MLRRTTLALAVATTLAVPSLAQDDSDTSQDQTRLESWLQSSLSGAGREVTVTGFSGALSSRAQLQELTIADDDGVWLRLSGVSLDWTRSAILNRRIAVNQLVADEIELVRLPASQGGPSAEASDFSLPELPVSIQIGEVSADRLILGPTVLGEAAEFQLNGSASLENGEGEAELELERTDGDEGRFALAGSYANATGQLALDLSLSEGDGGIVATKLDLPGAPALDLRVVGDDPLSDFTASVVLSTNDEERFAGEVQIASTTPDAATGGEQTGRNTEIKADLMGDLRPLFDTEYQAFFGGESLIHVDAILAANGTNELRDAIIRTDALDLRLAATINDQGWAEAATLAGSLRREDGEPVLLPIAGDPTTVEQVALNFNYDSQVGNGWTGQLDLTGLDRSDVTLSGATIAGAGALSPGSDGALPSVDGQVTLSVADLAMADAALAEALGSQLSGSLRFAKADETPLDLSDIAVSGADYGLTGEVTLSTDVDSLDLIAALDLELVAENLSRFAALAGVDLSGAASLAIAGDAAVPGGPFDLEITGETTDLALGIEHLDGLFAGDGTLFLAADRTLERTRISAARLTAPGVRLKAEGELAGETARIAAFVEMPDGSRLDPSLQGAVTLDVTAVQAAGDWTVEAEATGPGDLTADIRGGVGQVRGRMGPAEAQIILSAGSLAPYAGLAGRDLAGAVEATVSASGNLIDESFSISGTAEGQDLAFGLGQNDALFAGASTVDFGLTRDAGGVITVDRLDLATPQLTANATASSVDGESSVDFNARLANIELLVPGLPGAFSASGTAVMSGDTYTVDISGNGPGGMNVAVAGTVASTFETANLTVNGAAPLALANGFIGANQVDGTANFDLAVNGPLQLSSVSGNVSTTGTRVSLPTLKLALRRMDANISLSGGRAQVSVNSGVTSGGRIDVSGPVTLSAPYNANLDIALINLGLTDPSLYDTTVNGNLNVNGALTGGATISGRIETSAVEIRIPSSGFGVAGQLDGLRHVNAPNRVLVMQDRAGLNESSGNGGVGAAYPLDIVISVPNQVFIRGRGLDAELGGRIRVRGTTANLQPQGGLSLIRGRLDLLGNRLDLSEASATLQGSFSPYIRVVAATEVDDVAISVVIDGPASEPVVSFNSSPDLPEDEILSRLIFGRSLADISALQALKLANGVAQLSGRTGSGVVGKLRDGFGLSDLDVATNDDGNLAVTAGAYISDNVYTGVELAADGTAEVSINLDVTRNVTARGSVSSDGETALGVYFEKDY